jgi:hypothetical protein
MSPLPLFLGLSSENSRGCFRTLFYISLWFQGDWFGFIINQNICRLVVYDSSIISDEISDKTSLNKFWSIILEWNPIWADDDIFLRKLNKIKSPPANLRSLSWQPELLISQPVENLLWTTENTKICLCILCFRIVKYRSHHLHLLSIIIAKNRFFKV